MIVRRSIALVAGSASLAAAAVVSARQSAPAPADKTPRELYMANCATCHGETGDGKGTTVLERPARSFLDGGFSYGNTPEAALRTITHGIPGSLMPSFAAALNEEQRKALASYVIGLGPPVLNVEAKDTIMVVRDRAVVVRGKLPPIIEGAPERPRGLLIGLPSGLTFEYRIDDVQLLGVRSGEFVDRTDWIGRGGTALQPLGKLVHAVAREARTWRITSSEPGEHEPLTARLVSTTVSGKVAYLTYDLLADDGGLRGRVREAPAAVATTIGPGWKRTFMVEQRGDATISLRVSRVGTEIGRLDEKTAMTCVRAETNQGFDVALVRGPLGVVFDERKAIDDALYFTVRHDTPIWTLFELPGVTLAEDAVKRIEMIAKCAEQLP